MNGLTLRDIAFVSVIGGGDGVGVPYTHINDHLIVDYSGVYPWDIDVTSPNGVYSYSADSPKRYAFVSAINCPLLTSLTVNGTTGIQTMSYCNVYNSPKLQTLIVPNNNLESLDISSNISMSYLDFTSGSITNFTSSRSITTLKCSKNRMTKLNLTASVSMSQVTCSFNSLTSLGLSSLSKLTGVDANNNSTLTSITIPSSLANLNVASCGLTSLTLPPVTLATLNIASNPITLLNVTNAGASLKSLTITNCTSLQSIYCVGNTNLTSINFSGLTALAFFQGRLSGFTSINVTSRTTLTYLQFDNCTSCTSLVGLTSATGLRELYIDNSPVGNITLTNNTALIAAHLTNCGMTSVDVSANTNLSALWVYNNTSLSSLTISSAGALGTLLAYNCSLTRASVDNVLAALDAGGNSGGTADLSGGTNSAPSNGTDNANLRSLEDDKGWTVTVNECVPAEYDVPDTLSATLDGDNLDVSWNNIGYDAASVQVYVAYDAQTYDVPAGDTNVTLAGYTDATGEVWVRLGDGCGSIWSAWAVTTIV